LEEEAAVVDNAVKRIDEVSRMVFAGIHKREVRN